MIFAIGSHCYRAELRPDDGVNYAFSGKIDWWVATRYACLAACLEHQIVTSLSTSKEAVNRIFAGPSFAVAIYMLVKNAAAFAPASGQGTLHDHT
jgi:hypothetical protein